MNREDIVRMAKEAGLFIAYDVEGHFSGVVDSEMIDMYPDRNKERDRLNREQRFVEILTPFAALVASAEREACANSMAKIVMIPTYTHGALVKLSDVVNAIRTRGDVATNDTSQERVDKTSKSVHETWRDSASDYERGFIDGMQKQMQSSVDKAVNAMTQPTYYIPNKDERTWVGLTEQEQGAIMEDLNAYGTNLYQFARAIEAKLKEKNT